MAFSDFKGQMYHYRNVRLEQRYTLRGYRIGSEQVLKMCKQRTSNGWKLSGKKKNHAGGIQCSLRCWYRGVEVWGRERKDHPAVCSLCGEILTLTH